ncbi:MAG: STAS domain-containing protein [Desulfuromonadaceae bacterium]
MEIKLEMDNELIILKLAGNLVASTAEGLNTQIAKLIEKKYLFILLDLGRVDFIDSSGLGACIAIKRNLAANNGLLACTGLNENVRKVFRMTHADQKIMIFDDRQDAVNAQLERIRTAHI